MYYETFITDITIEEIADDLYFNDEWLDDLDEEDFDGFPPEEFWDALYEDLAPEFDDEFFDYVDDLEIGFDPYEGCYTFDC